MSENIGTSDVEICSGALVLIGQKPLSSLSGNDDKTISCNTLYPRLRDGLLAEYPWRFTMKKQALSQNVQAPDNEWTYSYDLPPNRITGTGPVAVFNSTSVGAKPIPGDYYDIFGDKLFTDQPVIVVDYQAPVSEKFFPAYFAQMLLYEMAYHLAESATDDTQKAEFWRTHARGSPAEAGHGGFWAVATNADARQQVRSVSPGVFDLVAVRQ